MRSKGESTRILLKSNDWHTTEETYQWDAWEGSYKEETTHLSTTRVTHWPRLCALYCVAWPAAREWQRCLRSGPPSCRPCCKPLQRYTSPRCPPSQMYCRATTKRKTTSNLHRSGCYCEAQVVQMWRTHKAMRPSDAMLNTTLPMAATPTLRPCVREEKARGSTLPTRPDGDLNWGHEHGPKADVLRFASIERSRRAFTLPWEDTAVHCEDVDVVLPPSSGSNWDNMGQGKNVFSSSTATNWACGVLILFCCQLCEFMICTCSITVYLN